MQLFAIKDLKADELVSYFVERNAPCALRGFDSLVNDGQSVMAKFPGDYALVFIATIDDIVAANKVTQLAVGSDLLRRPKETPNA